MNDDVGLFGGDPYLTTDPLRGRLINAVETALFSVLKLTNGGQTMAPVSTVSDIGQSISQLRKCLDELFGGDSRTMEMQFSKDDHIGKSSNSEICEELHGFSQRNGSEALLMDENFSED
uniref:Uncharacterized protein n=1 Tax=Trichuris muris TaxID=70415 RepID=A0A5S6QV35_TRIMR